MIMRGNVVYNNWNRIPFFVTQLPDNSGNTNPNYGTATYNNILDGQGIYVTRSDPEYYGIFLFENNLCVNNGKNGINFDNSLGASAIYQNNTLYYNGVHEIIQDLSVAQGNPGHRGQKVGGIKANKVLNATVVNNIVVTRDDQFSALQLNNVSGTKNAVNNIFQNGTVAFPGNQEPANQINVDPLFSSVPNTVIGPIEMSTTDFSLTADSPAIDAGNSSFSPVYDIDGNLRPSNNTDAVSFSSFENSTDGWGPWGGATLSLTDEAAQSGSNSLYVSGRTANWHSPRIYLDNLLTVGETYTFYVSVKLTPGSSGTADLTIRSDLADSDSDSFWFYVKGPSVVDGEAASFYIDDFSLVSQGSGPVDFSSSENIIDIGAYEYIDPSLGFQFYEFNLQTSFIYPNPARDSVFVSGVSSESTIVIIDLLGKKYDLTKTIQLQSNGISFDINSLRTGFYLIKVFNNNSSKTFKLFKE